MTFNQWVAVLSLVLTFLGIVGIPLLVLFWKTATKMTRIDGGLKDVADNLKLIVQDKDRAHSEMTIQMNRDREVTDKRLRWLEEFLWSKGGRS